MRLTRSRTLSTHTGFTCDRSGRATRVLTLLEECADRLQIVILTCHPERYRGLEEAKFFDLQPLCH